MGLAEADDTVTDAVAPAREVKVGQLYGVAKAVLGPLIRLGWRLDVRGLEHVPSSGGAIIAPNHLSVIDHFVVGAALNRRITYVGKAEYLDSWKTRYLFPAMGMIPIDRGGGSAAQRALDAAARLLAAGELFGIYPEGTRSRDGQLHKGHTGVARLALRTGAPIVPVGLIGTDEVQPPDAPFPRPFRVMRVSFGRPIDVGRYAGREGDRLVLRQITDEVMFDISHLSGQRYVDTYASRKDVEDALPADTARMPRGDEVASGDASVGADPAGPAPARRSSAEVLGRRQAG